MNTTLGTQCPADVGLTRRERKQQRLSERKLIEQWCTTPEQQLIAQHQAQPKTTPSQATLRQCVIESLSVAQMDILASASGTIEYLEVVQRVCRFSLWATYRKDLKALKEPQVQLHYLLATTTRTKLRDAYRHLTCMYALFHLAKDSAVRAEREAWELSASLGSQPRRTNTPRL